MELAKMARTYVNQMISRLADLVKHIVTHRHIMNLERWLGGRQELVVEAASSSSHRALERSHLLVSVETAKWDREEEEEIGISLKLVQSFVPERGALSCRRILSRPYVSIVPMGTCLANVPCQDSRSGVYYPLRKQMKKTC